jgi:hypothetical protein
MIETLMLLAITLSSPRLDVQVQEQECIIKQIRYEYIHTYIHAVGNCNFIYEKCARDKCDVEKIEEQDLNFGKKNVG